MPNCDFYATTTDHAVLLDWLFAEKTCEVYESYSRYEQPLRHLATSSDVLAMFDERPGSVYLQLRVLGASPPFVPQRISLDPEKCDGATFRFAAEGWGLVQLYLGAVFRGGLQDSHTNHFSKKGAGKWEPFGTHDTAVNAWDFPRITAFSSRLNRQVRKQAVGKIASRVVLPGALALWEGGMDFPPYAHGSTELVRVGASSTQEHP